MNRSGGPEFDGGWYVDALPGGKYGVLFENQFVRTHLGDLKLAAVGDNPLYLVVHEWKGLFYMAGQSHLGRGALLWSEADRQWHVPGVAADGQSPCLFRAGELLVAIGGDAYVAIDLETFAVSAPQPAALGSQGFRYVDDAGNAVTGDDTLNFQRRVALEQGITNLWEFSCVGGLPIGQGLSGVHVLTPDHRMLEDGNTTFVRVHRDGDAFAVSIVKPDEAVIIEATRTELLALPLVSEPAPPPVVVTPPVVVVPPPVNPPVNTGAAMRPFDMSTLILHGPGAPDFRNWPVTTTISEINITNEHDAFRITFDAMHQWPRETPPGWTGGIQYTMCMALDREGAWHGAAVIECWDEDRGFGGPPQEVGKNWFDSDSDSRARWLPLNQPQAGEWVVMWIVRGDTRMKDIPGGEERSQPVAFQWANGPQRVVASDAPAPVPVTPTPPATPTQPPATGSDLEARVAALESTEAARGALLDALNTIVSQWQAPPPAVGGLSSDEVDKRIAAALNNYVKHGTDVTLNGHITVLGRQLPVEVTGKV